MAKSASTLPGTDPKLEDEAQVEEEVLPVEEEEDGTGEVVAEDAEEYDSRKMPPDEEVWPDGPNFAQINEWKDTYGDVFVTALTPDKFVVWRTLTRPEYRALTKSMETALSQGATQSDANLNNEEAIAELCILFPKYDRRNPKAMAGEASTIAMQVMEASAFSAVEVRQL